MRKEARLYTDIWDDDPDWTALTFAAQWAYTMLLSQRDLEHHGGIALRIPRWSHLASDMTEPILTQAIDELEEHRFVILDRAYGELFVRSLVRGDRVYKQPNVLRSAADRLSEVRSPVILAAMHAELQRVNDLPDLTENCRLIVKEMLEATSPGAPRPVRRPRRRPATASQYPSGDPGAMATGDPSAGASENPSGEDTPNPSGRPSGRRAAKPTSKAAPKASSKNTAKGSRNRSANPDGETSAKASAYRTGKPSAQPAADATPVAAATPDAAPPAPPAAPLDPPSRGSGNPAPIPSANPPDDGLPQPDPAAGPAPAPHGHRAIMGAWLRSTGDRVPPADLVEQVGRVLADALQVSGSAQRTAKVLARWQDEDGTDPARLAAMIANAAPPDVAAAAEAASPTATGAAPLDAEFRDPWDSDALAAATTAITQPWLHALTDQPTAEALRDIEYHVTRALTDGYSPEHIAAHLAAWYASGSDDPWQLTDLIEGVADATPQQGHPVSAVPPISPATTTPTDDDTPANAEEWLATAKAQP